MLITAQRQAGTAPASRTATGPRGSPAEQPPCPQPDDARVEPAGVEPGHLVVELPGGRLVVEQPDHVLEILPGFVQDGRVVGPVIVLVSRDDGARERASNPGTGPQPFAQAA